MPCESVRDVSGISIDGYRPSTTIDFRRTVHRLDAFAQEQCQAILPLVEAGRLAEILPFQIACANECAKAVADMVNQFFLAYRDCIDFLPQPAPASVDLLHNGDFSIPGDSPDVPEGWVMYWENRADADVDIRRVASADGAEVVARNAGDRVACLTTWPRVVRGVPGQRFVVSGEVCCDSGEAGIEALCLDDATCPIAEVRKAASADGGWERVEMVVTMPENAEILRPGVYARNAEGPARFRACRVRVGSGSGRAHRPARRRGWRRRREECSPAPGRRRWDKGDPAQCCR
jgi:hypothetical protein